MYLVRNQSALIFLRINCDAQEVLCLLCKQVHLCQKSESIDVFLTRINSTNKTIAITIVGVNSALKKK